jgi:hypothetical protein
MNTNKDKKYVKKSEKKTKKKNLPLKRKKNIIAWAIRIYEYMIGYPQGL